ncbi:iron chelate uptake ABC transporter family permease subunit [Auraticoccus sp. F435]|uniref:Iron chelate uptake ABC transporter family permease subunit n=2 Tax=Auraticoccus cholistanensis TaxID=2656650 RepID=A0A6A9UU49_9ACTN|nr:iron chelate uptake ABC transporter family permease subunit [Auraticoccus cholistanensis]MVA76201.1 iron chelate uptake ABC transporter family permease subunit [Auraticoccus cholistanensis]
MTAGLLLASWLSLGVGVSNLRPHDLLSPTPEQWELLAVSRVPRLLAVLLAGAALSVAGLIMQRITQNRFVSPSTSGTVESAVLGILLATLLMASAPLVVKMLVAIVTSIAGTLVFLRLLEGIRHNDGIVVALVGIMYGGVISAVTTFVAYQLDLLQMLDVWTTGSFSGVLEGRYEPIFVVVLAGVVGYLFADRFTVVGMGADFATNLGVNYRVVLYTGLVVVSVMAAVVTVVVGALPFLGLVVPNVVSLLLGDNVRAVLPVTALAGAGFVLVCDVVGRLLRFPYEIPASTIAGVVGGVVFVLLILRAAGSPRNAGSTL